MPRYSEETIAQVREANDIVDVIGQHIKLTKKGANYFGLCPFHGEKTPSFSVSPQKQIYYCFGCGAGGNVINFLMEYENMSFTEALRSLADRAGIALPEAGDSGEQFGMSALKRKLYDINKDAAYFYYDRLKSREGAQGLEYFREERRLSDRTITHFGLGYAGKQRSELYEFLKGKGYDDESIKTSGLVIFDEQRISDRFWNRVMFPIMDQNSRVVGFGGRVMGDGQPKYLNSPETPIFDKSSVLYGLNFARKSRKPQMLLCEGYMDVIALHQAGFTNAVASLGTAFNEKHARLLRRYTEEVILTQDSDEAGIKAKLRAFPILRDAGLNVRVLDMKGHKDPDEFIKEEGAEAYEALIRGAKNAFMYETGVIRDRYDLSDPAMKTRFYEELADKLCMFTESLERDNYIQAVSHEYMINYDELKKLVEYRFLKSGVRQKERIRDEKQREETEKRAVRMEAPHEGRSENASLKAQRLLIAWGCSDPEVLRAVRAYLEPSDFNEGIMRELYEELLRESDEGEASASRLMELYPDDEEKRMQAGLVINSDSGYKSLQDMRRQELEKAVTTAVQSIRACILDRETEACGDDILKLQELFKKKKELEKLHVSFGKT